MASLSRKNWRIHINGVVQSVGFRPFIKNLGDKANIKGFVKNLGDAGVEIVIQSDEIKKDEFIEMIKDQLPELAVITNIKSMIIEEKINFLNQFEIKKSDSSSTNSFGFSAIPPDISICKNCSNDIVYQNRRIDYPFTSCTDCGPRYATIMDLPYDRPFTSFNQFPLCDDCHTEYVKPSDRRFHAQTTCCESCGPTYMMYKWNNEWLALDFNWETVVDSLNDGKIISVMGLSGTHFVMDALNSSKVKKFRSLRRQQSAKPFAVMMKNIGDVEKYCLISDLDKRLLMSARKPIIILPVRNQSLWNDVSPGLNSIGVMLPYSGFHHILFNKGAPAVLIMTSGNLPGIPMPINPLDVLESSKFISEIVLVHNREIVQRNDDSVIRSHGDSHLIIRRARGYTPQPFFVKQLLGQKQSVAFGSEENNTLTFHKAGWVLPSQHLGHITNLESQIFQNVTLKHLTDLFRFNPEIVMTDLHPDFLTTKSANVYADLNDLPVHPIQHHVAHAASLALEHNISRDDPILTWVCDGFGYGTDGNAWGGELLLMEEGSWERVSSLIPVDYEGGDQNAKYPARMLLNYLKQINGSLEYLSENAEILFGHGKQEFDYLANKAANFNLSTTSLARLLDSFAVILGITERRSYRGEPAIKLEGLASKGSLIVDCEEKIGRFNNMDVLDNLKIMKEGLDHLNSLSTEDLACWLHQTIGKTMGTIAGNLAQRKGISNIGFSGGVAYNKLITESFKAELSNFEVELLIHNNIPPGDGGVSVGQIYYQGVMQNE